MKNNSKTLEVETGQNFSTQTDKELLEDFLNSLDQCDEVTTDINSVTPEIRLDKFLYVIKLKEVELERCNSIAEESISKTQRWLETKEQRIKSTIEYLSAQMKNYLRTQNLKSLSLPMGMIGFRKQPGSIEITDKSLFLASAKPELIRHIPENFEPDLKAIKEYIKQTGDLPDGIDFKENEDRFYYKLKTD